MSTYQQPLKTRVAIVDDEPAQRELMTRYIQQENSLDLVATLSTYDEALNTLEQLEIDLLFLDVDLGSHDAFELLDALSNRAFDIIFCTSHSEYALQAFHVSAIDYLLKPFSQDQFIQAVLKFKKLKPQPTTSHDALENLLENLKRTTTQQKIALPTSQGLLFVKFNEIVHVESQNTLTIFYLTDRQQIVVSRTMKECEELLNTYGFCRVHQSHLINLQFVKKYIKGEGGQVVLEDGSTIEVSRRKKEEFLSALQKI
jgi:two-component system, LytTR family, response regulator